MLEQEQKDSKAAIQSTLALEPFTTKTIMNVTKPSVGTAITELFMKLDSLAPADLAPAQPSTIIPYNPRFPMRDMATIQQLVAQTS